MRHLALLAALVVAAPLGAQARQQADADPTRKVAAAKLPAGWRVRLDDKDAQRYSVNDTRLVKAGKGYRITSGPAALYYSPKMAPTSSEYTVRATFNSPTRPRHAEAYGIFLTGTNLDDADKQTYVYFLVRGDGRFLINHRAGKDVHKIHDWQETPAANKRNAAGAVRDELVVKVAMDSLRFLVNNRQVAAIGRKYYGEVKGHAGLRVNHNLDVQVERFEVKKGAK